jgi:hypothetical protein
VEDEGKMEQYKEDKLEKKEERNKIRKERKRKRKWTGTPIVEKLYLGTERRKAREGKKGY